jgi:hypothetical protein
VKRSVALVAACPVLLAACGAGSILGDKVCTTEARAGITVTVVDSVTGALAGRGSTIVAREGTFTDVVSNTFTSQGDGPYGLVYERAGVYTVSVQQSGYVPWLKNNVQVTAGECHVNGTTVTARLQH